MYKRVLLKMSGEAIKGDTPFGIDPATVRQRAIRGAYQTARKVGRNWTIDKHEPHIDHRVKSGQYVKKNENGEG